MSFFRTVWLWIKRLLFIAAMVICVLASITFIGDSAANRTALTVFLAILGIVLSLGNCVLYFLFDQRAKLLVILGLVLHLILEIALFLLSEDSSSIVICIVCVAACLVFTLNLIGRLLFMSREDTEKLANKLTGKW